MLTPKRSQLLKYIREYHKEHGYAPTFVEMKDFMNLRSVSGIHPMLKALESGGYIRRVRSRARGIDLPHDLAQSPNAASLNTNTTAILAGHTSQKTEGKSATIPLMGTIAAGTPLDVISQEVDRIELPASMLRANQSHYALRVVGDSMIGAGILPSDIAVITNTSEARNGDIVVALVDQSEATLKHFFHAGRNDVVLVAANPQYTPVQLHQSRVSIQGRLQGVLRTYEN